MLYEIVMPSPLGPLVLVASDQGLRAILWGPDDALRVEIGEVNAGPDPAGVLAATEVQLNEYFEGQRTDFDIALDPVGTPFQKSVWEVLRTIPYGETITYGEQAKRLGDAKKARAVGAANGRNPISIIVPCHRVVGSNGSLTGFAAGLDSKAFLLDLERWQPTKVS